MKTLKRLGVIMMSVTACAWISGCSGSEPQTNTPNAAADGSAQTPSENPGGAGDKTCAASEASGDKTGTAGDEANAGSEKGKTLVAFYSASGRTKRVAGIIADATQGTLFELVPSPAIPTPTSTITTATAAFRANTTTRRCATSPWRKQRPTIGTIIKPSISGIRFGGPLRRGWSITL